MGASGMNGLNDNSFIGFPLNKTIFQFFLRNLFVFYQDGRSSLHEAMLEGDCGLVEKIIQAGADANLRDHVSKLCG